MFLVELVILMSVNLIEAFEKYGIHLEHLKELHSFCNNNLRNKKQNRRKKSHIRTHEIHTQRTR